MSTPIDMDAVIDELRRGWVQGQYGSLTGGDPRCLASAVGRASEQECFYVTEAVRVALATPLPKVIREQFPDRLTGAASWVIEDFNDHPDTTLDDVILVCEKARAEQ